MAKESVLRPFYTVLVLAFACSALVAGAAVGLRPRQEANQLVDQKKNILRAAGLYHPGEDVNTLFAAIETRVIRLDDGTFVPPAEIDPTGFSPAKAAQSDNTGKALPKNDDLAGLSRLEKYSLVYLVHKGGMIDQIILPVRGKGLWSTMYGYVALNHDLTTINGVTFYRHGETPGLGGEIENQSWRDTWQGKKIYDPAGRTAFQVAKGRVEAAPNTAQYQVDGISGATLTMTGVTNLMRFWFGDHGFKPFLERFQKQGGIDG